MVKKVALRSRQWVLLLAALVLFVQPVAFCAAAQETPKAVLVLHSYHQGLEWTDSISRGIVSTLGKNAHPVTVQFEYMDTKRIADEQHLENLAKLLRHKYSKHQFDVLSHPTTLPLTFFSATSKTSSPAPRLFFAESTISNTSRSRTTRSLPG